MDNRKTGFDEDGKSLYKDQSRERLLPYAEKGDAVAQYLMSWCLDAGGEERLDWLRKAAGQGLAEAQCRLGISYCTDSSFFGCVNEDYDEARRWLLLAAEQGEAMAMSYLSVLSSGYKEQAEWARKARKSNSRIGTRPYKKRLVER